MARIIFKVLLVLRFHIRKFRLQILERLQAWEFSHTLSSCGDNVIFHYPCQITALHKMKVGNNVHINSGAFIRAEGGLEIGDNVHIARNVTIYTMNHNYEGAALPYDHTIVKKPVLIEKNVWIGINVTIVPGVKIGEGAIIGAGTVVSRDVPRLAIVGSQPVRILKYRDPHHYKELEDLGIYGGANGIPLNNNSGD